MYITQDSSWYSAARNQTNAIVGLIDASRPPSTPTGDIQTAALTNFSNATSPYTMGSFNVMKQSAYTSDTNGDFELNKKPGITTSNYNVYMTALSLVLRNAKNITYTLSGGELDSSIVKTIDVSGSEIISISNNSAFTNIEIKIDSTVTPQTEVILQGVFFGAALQIDQQDIEQITVSDKIDITMTSLPSQSISITCFDSDYKYRNFFDNGTKYIYVRFEYIGNEQTFSSKNFVVIKKDDSENGSKTSLNTTKMTGTDFLTYMSDEYSETPIALYPSPSGFVNIRDKIVDALTWAKDHYKNVFDLNFSVGVEVALLDTTRPVASTQFNVALQKLCNADGAAVTLNNEFVKVDYDYLGDSNILAKQKNYINISFSEQFNKPIEKIYPKIKELSLTKYQFRQNDEKVLLCDKASIYLIYRVSDVVYFDSIVWIPDFDDTLYTGYVELYTDDGTKYTPESIGRDSSVFNYTVGSDYISVNNGTGGTLGGDIKLTVYGNKINFDRLISKYQLNSEGENLTIDNEYIDALMSEYDINEYVNEIAKGYDLTTEHQLSARGNFDILAGDIILYQADNTGTRYGLVTNHILKYNGALQSELTVLDVSSYSSLTPANDLFPNDNLFIRN